MPALDPACRPSGHEWTSGVESTHDNKPSPTMRSTHIMSPRTDPRAASLGSNPDELSALLARSLGEAQHALQDEAQLLHRPSSRDFDDPTAAVRRELREAATAWSSLAQACATGLLAARAAALVAAIEADNETGHLVFPSAPSGSDGAR